MGIWYFGILDEIHSVRLCVCCTSVGRSETIGINPIEYHELTITRGA